MLQLALLLVGRQFVRRNRFPLMLVGVLWGALGAAILSDGMLGVGYFPLTLFGWLLLCESLITLLMASGARGAKRAIRVFKGGFICCVSLVILSGYTGSNLLLAIIMGFICFLTGTFVIASAWVVRYPHWRRALGEGLCQVAFAIFLFLPYPSHHDGTVPQFIGVLMLLSAVNTVLLARRLSHLEPGITIFDVQSSPPEPLKSPGEVAAGGKANARIPELTVHVWTPTGSSRMQTIPRPVVSRYIAAEDVNGVISTGHAALEMEDLYISLYPAVDIDRSPSEFFRTLKAVRENDVPGLFQRDYASESAAWCPSDRKVIFHAFNAQALRAFAAHYRQQEVYNLTWRNCSSSVAFALEAALDGVLCRGSGWGSFFRLFLYPELWIAAQLRRRATTMAWTPGLVLDYSRALHGLVHPGKLIWFKRSARPDTPAQR
ncbi:peptidase [Pluralibacter gergoviae]|uniref:HdeD family acid-resistance protein n=1 Tax=Pluralibacter gergoviae TaxID=61647 RepID=UPI000651033F|nr:tripartite tricarboxylate transporter TctB family protein [Pluralibacter gergoviae]KMK16906.1 peptidase [Pluralibacter gergoviae]